MPGQDPDTGYVVDPIDTCRYRNGWLISNGTSIFVYDLSSNRWFEWPYAVERFIIGHDPYYEDISLSSSVANEFTYLRFIENADTQIPALYATDGTIQASTWEIPKILFENDVIVRTITFYWEYSLIYNYENKDMDSAARSAQSVVAEIDIYLDDSDTSVKTLDFTPSEDSDGKYKSVIYVNTRCRKFAFKLSGSAMKYFRLTGYRIDYEDRGRKSLDG